MSKAYNQAGNTLAALKGKTMTSTMDPKVAVDMKPAVLPALAWAAGTVHEILMQPGTTPDHPEAHAHQTQIEFVVKPDGNVRLAPAIPGNSVAARREANIKRAIVSGQGTRLPLRPLEVL